MSEKSIILNTPGLDPRTAPVSRINQAKLVELEDGEYGVEVVTEFFDGGISELTDIGNKEVFFQRYKQNEFEITLWERYSDNKAFYDKITYEIGNIFNCSFVTGLRNSLDEIPVLTISGGFTIYKKADGFYTIADALLKRIGLNGVSLLKGKLKEFYTNKRKDSNEEHLLVFEFTIKDVTIRKNNEPAVFEFIMTNPSDLNIDNFFDIQIKDLDKVIGDSFKVLYDKPIRKFVFEIEEGVCRAKFGIRADGAPVSLVTPRTINGE